VIILILLINLKYLIMKNKHTLIICFIILIFRNTCYPQSPIVIDIADALQKDSKVKCSAFIDGLEYIPLEANSDCLIDKSPSIEIMDDIIVINTINKCLIFSQKGKFKGEIGTKGKGPGEYRSNLKVVDPVARTVLFKGWNKNILEYNLKNELERSILIPLYRDDFSNPSFPSEYTINNGNIVCYFTNTTGKEKKLLMEFTKDDSNPIYIIPNSNIIENKGIVFCTNEIQFYNFNEDVFFKENCNDTIFKLLNHTLVPHIVFNTGKYHFSYKMKRTNDMLSGDYIVPENICESNKFVWFQFRFHSKRFFGLFIKSEDKLRITEISEGLVNDIDGFINFNPTNKSHNNLAIAIINAFEIVNWFQNNPDKTAKLPLKLQNLKNIKETDNPIIIMGKLRN
jgi:hypothetical protein